MKKKLLSVFMACVMLLSCSIFAGADMTLENNNSEDRDSIILAQALALQDEASIAGKTFEVVTANQDNGAVALNGNTNCQKVIQSVNEVDGLIEVTTILPYMELENGQLVDSFDYSPSNISTYATETSTGEMTYANVTVRAVAYFDEVKNPNILGDFINHIGVTVIWSRASGTSATVTNLLTAFTSTGELHAYPACTTAADLDDSLLPYSLYPSEYVGHRDDYNNYTISSIISQSEPGHNTYYSDWNNSMPENRYLYASFLQEHGGVIYVSFTVNGTTYEKSFTAWEKLGIDHNL